MGVGSARPRAGAGLDVVKDGGGKALPSSRRAWSCREKSAACRARVPGVCRPWGAAPGERVGAMRMFWVRCWWNSWWRAPRTVMEGPAVWAAGGLSRRERSRTSWSRRTRSTMRSVARRCSEGVPSRRKTSSTSWRSTWSAVLGDPAAGAGGSSPSSSRSNGTKGQRPSSCSARASRSSAKAWARAPKGERGSRSRESTPISGFVTAIESISSTRCGSARCG